MAQGWLFTVLDEQDDAAPGDRWELWTDAPINEATNEVRRRSDGEPYTPAWGPGDGVVMYHPSLERCVAVLIVVGEPRFKKRRRQFDLVTRVVFWDSDTGPRLPDIGIEKALQGGRHRLTSAQYTQALSRFEKLARRRDQP